MSTYLDEARSRAQDAREFYEAGLRDRETGESLAVARPTTFSDCASLYEQSALAYRVASALGSMGMFAAADSYAAQGAALDEAAQSCEASASGQIIEV